MRHAAVLLFLGLATAAHAIDVDWTGGGAGADTIFVAPIDSTAPKTIRAGITIDPFKIEGSMGEAIVLPMEMQIGTPLAEGHTEITRAQASILRAYFAKLAPVNIITGYRNLDRGIEWGVDLIGFRVPIRLTKNGEIVILPGLELGVRHYQAPIDATAVHASFILEGRAAYQFLNGFLGTGVIGRVRYDLDKTAASGFEEGAMGYVSVLLNEKREIYARVYGGIQHQASLEALGLPTTNAIGGLSIFGKFGSRE